MAYQIIYIHTSIIRACVDVLLASTALRQQKRSQIKRCLFPSITISLCLNNKFMLNHGRQIQCLPNRNASISWSVLCFDTKQFSELNFHSCSIQLDECTKKKKILLTIIMISNAGEVRPSSRFIQVYSNLRFYPLTFSYPKQRRDY